MATNIVPARSHAYREQSGRCIYCGAPMWSQAPEQFSSAYGISLADARRFQLTAEHLKARSDGGGNGKSNIVAACLFCNRMRHQRKTAPPPDIYQAFVQQRIARGKWHPAHLHCKMLRSVNV